MANYNFSEGHDSARSSVANESTLTERVYDALHDEIVSGAVRPGTRLVRRTLSKRLGVSPMPVVEALLRLEVDGLVESRPLHGARVRPLSYEDVRNDEVIREAVECQAARTCAEHATDADLARLLSMARTVDRMMAHGDPRSKLGMQSHLDFHLAVARSGGFPRLADELERLWFRRLMRLNWIKATHYKRVPDDWHASLVEVIESRDPNAADAKMREHVRYGSEDDRQAIEFVLTEINEPKNSSTLED